MSLILVLKGHTDISFATLQAAVVGFIGDQIRPAYTAFADFLAEEHDRTASQLGQIFYDNGTVRYRPFHVQSVP